MSKAEYFSAANVVLIVSTIAMLSFGQVLFKSASSNLVVSLPGTWLSLPLFLGLGLYGLATVGWLVVLSRIPLSLAFPFYGLSFLMVPVIAAIFLGEPLRWQTFLGGLLILLGIAVTSWRPQV